MNLDALWAQAQSAHQSGNLALAYSLYQDLLKQGYQREAVLSRLAHVCIQAQDLDAAANYLEQLCTLYPSKLAYYEARANLYVKQQRWMQAAVCYLEFLRSNPSQADGYYNAAYYLKQAGEYARAIENYQQALEHGISQPEEVLTNMAVIYSEHLRQEDQAKSCLERALNQLPSYTPAMFNLATLYEEEGDKAHAAKLYEKIVEFDPSNHRALARLAEAQRILDPSAPIISKLQTALVDSSMDDFSRTNIHYALGKALDDCGEFDDAFKHYAAANDLDRSNNPLYSKERQEQIVDDNINFFTEDWFNRHAPTSDASPIFICGMFRSGSTLAEQVLASHSSLTAGGERDFFYKLARSNIDPYPVALEKIEFSALQEMANDYLADLAKAFPGDARPTDKRPDNFLHIGLIKTLFPRAKFIQTNRNPRDNCLSIYFLRTAASMSYAANLTDIAHYYKQYLRLMAHWRKLFPENVYALDYDRLVVDPEPIVRDLLAFLDLPWEPQCLDFHRLKNRVKTASIWQVRQPLYQSSSGRWKNYQNNIADLIAEFAE
ncbi:tetratricopeptide repeat-containing sulfotransferase family protein [Arenicella xantha]|uniref:Tfp pilus assembly protein PilF n=1 Tax=Arenicella xantha TaxID=644221 RepID=A0A395JSG6_9GAMM|nr:tetratricopeptide repeat-containing sulfotransferase family protein [Arenicella xantha]RBP53292.1 Tfp pilus assembly protein PilF [Arenicella xantha]